MGGGYHRFRPLSCGLLLLLLTPLSAFAYIGPGAGFALIGSLSIVFITILLTILTILLWPLTMLWRSVAGKRMSKNAKVKRVVILGLDGLEPKLVDQFMEEGSLPNLEKLKETGCYHRLATTTPPISPVAWSSFQTGVNPGAHNIFDFITRDKRNYLPSLSSTVTKEKKVDLLRKSQPFWKILGKSGVFSTVIRVPISYPPEKFYGNILSAMCTPDLRGTQGTFSFFSESTCSDEPNYSLFSKKGDKLVGELVGPPNSFKKDSPEARLTFTVQRDGEGARLRIGKTEIPLKVGEFSDWQEVTFKLFPGVKVKGICRFCLKSADPEIGLYVSPLNIHPAKPVLPIAAPLLFSQYYARRLGLFGTLGLMEDTWGRNSDALDDQTFLEQAYLTHAEREEMFFDSLRTTKTGMCMAVFDASDRIQHMFWKQLEEGTEKTKDVIPEMYQKMDDLVGRTVEKLKEDDLLIVMSDHGFTSFRRCLNLNGWLHKEGYLALKEGKATSGDYLKDVDWSKTQAFAVGLTGIYLNVKGREEEGILSEAEANRISAEISRKLCELRDQEKGQQAVKEVYRNTEVYQGLYATEAPDLIVGYAPGYRVSWESAVGAVEEEIFADNTKAWTGDHNVVAADVPGIFLANKAIKHDKPDILDLAPSVLDLFAVKIPTYMEGKPLFA